MLQGGHYALVARRVLLLRKGRVLTPNSRWRYRLERIRRGRTAGLDTDDELAVASLALRLVSLPFVVLLDYVTWPIVGRLLGGGPWRVVELRWHGPDAEFVRLAEASSRDEASRMLKSIAASGDRASAP